MSTNFNLQATFNAIIVKPIADEETTYGSIIVPDLGKSKNIIGEIVSVGPGHYAVTGQFIPTTLRKGMKVMLPTMGPTSITFEGDEYWTCPENTVLGIILN